MLRLLLKAGRTETLPLLLFPFVIGTVLAWQTGSPFQAGFFLLALLGTLTAHLGTNILAHSFETVNNTDQPTRGLHVTGPTTTGNAREPLQTILPPHIYRRLVPGLMGTALLCGLLLTIARPYTLLFGVAGFLLAYFYVAPPLRLAYLGRGLGELDISLSFGILPVLSAYYIQSGTLSIDALLAAIPISLYTVTVFYFQHFLHWHADRTAQKITPIVALGEHRGRIVGGLLLLCISLSLIMDVVLDVLPWYLIVTILTTVPVLVALHYARGAPKDYQLLVQRNLSSAFQTFGMLLIALFLRGFLHI